VTSAPSPRAEGPGGPRGDLPPLVLSAAGSISGTVVDEQGRPLPGTWVQADWLTAFTAAAPQAWTAADGAFRISGLEIRKAYQIEVCRPGFAPRSFGLGLMTAAVSGLHVVLRRGVGVTGVLVEAGGRCRDPPRRGNRAARPDHRAGPGRARLGGALRVLDALTTL
jgi:hypothetical protein